MLETERPPLHFNGVTAQVTGGTLFPFCHLQFVHPLSGATRWLNSDHITMEVEVSGEYGMTPQTGIVKLYNLSDATRHFVKRLMHLSITLGYYDGTSNTVLTGVITRVDPPEQRGADEVVELRVLDTTWALASKRVEATFINREVSDIVRELHRAVGLPILRIEEMGVRVPRFVSGAKSVKTTVEELMGQYAPRPWKYHIRQGSVVFASVDVGFASGVVLTHETGLISANPVGNEYSDDVFFNKSVASVSDDILKGGSSTSDASVQQTEDAAAMLTQNQTALLNKDALAEALAMRDFQFDSIMQPGIVADSIVFLQNRRTRGWYRAKSYRHQFSRTSFRTSGQLTPISRTSLGA